MKRSKKLRIILRKFKQENNNKDYRSKEKASKFLNFRQSLSYVLKVKYNISVPSMYTKRIYCGGEQPWTEKLQTLCKNESALLYSNKRYKYAGCSTRTKYQKDRDTLRRRKIDMRNSILCKFPLNIFEPLP